MANPEHLERLTRGTKAEWNKWRKLNSQLEIDISLAHLSRVDLQEANLRGANLSGSNLRETNLIDADLRSADLTDAVLDYAKLYRADLLKANFRGARLVSARLADADLTDACLDGIDAGEAQFTRAVLRGAQIRNAKLPDADLQSADLRKANLECVDMNQVNLVRARLAEAILKATNLYGANMRDADFTNANLQNVDFRSSNMQNARLDGSNATGIRLWETQRAGWSIKGIQCETAFWDRKGTQADTYLPGEFERLYSEQASIELFYQGGVSTFELNTLPALLHHLASLHPDQTIRLKSLEETGGGAKISISVGDIDAETFEQIKSDTERIQQAQLALRDREIERLQIQKEYLEDFLSEKLMRTMLTAGGPQNVFSAPVTGVVISSGNSRVDFRQSVNDPSEILDLLRKLDEHRADLRMNPEESSKLGEEIRTATTELKKETPDQTVLSKSMRFIEKMAEEAFTKAAGKLGEGVASADWSSWLRHLNDFVHHLGL